MNYTEINQKFCGLEQRTKGSCGTSEEVCQYQVNHYRKELSFKGTGAMKDYQSGKTEWYEKREMITTVSINGITSIGSYALDGLTTFKTLTIPSTITSISEYAFNGCSGITHLDYPTTVTAPVNAFDGCSSITPLKIIGKSEDGPMQDFQATKQPWYNQREKINTVEIVQSVTIIGICAFDGMTSLKPIEIHDNITSIGNYAFRSSGLTTINLNKVETIGESSFESCLSLETVTLSQSNKFTTIPTKAFASCSSIQSISIPSNIQTFNSNAFNGCSKLSSATFEKGLQTIGEYSFELTGIETLVIPSSVSSIGLYAFRHCDSLSSIQVTEGNTKYSVESQGGLIEKTSETETTLVLYPKQKTSTNNV